MGPTRKYCFWTLALTLLLSAGCRNDVADGSLQLRLEETAGPDAIVFNQMIYEAPAGHTYSVITLRYYLSRIQLRSASGTVVDLADVVYRDALDAETGKIDVGAIPHGAYTSLEFVFGLDEVMNVDGGLQNTLENINMEWPIPGDQGYHYMKFEGKYDTYHSDTINSFNLHLGATGGNQNYFRVTLPLQAFSADGNDWQIALRMDVREWLRNPENYDFEEFGAAIMMNQQAQEVLRANGASVFSISGITKSHE